MKLELNLFVLWLCLSGSLAAAVEGLHAIHDYEPQFSKREKLTQGDILFQLQMTHSTLVLTILFASFIFFLPVQAKSVGLEVTVPPLIQCLHLSVTLPILPFCLLRRERGRKGGVDASVTQGTLDPAILTQLPVAPPVQVAVIAALVMGGRQLVMGTSTPATRPPLARRRMGTGGRREDAPVIKGTLVLPSKMILPVHFLDVFLLILLIHRLSLMVS
jgi:hypothetical protein